MMNQKKKDSILFACGLILLAAELFKQGFLYFIEFDRHYDWWYFPFQLCSIPMYLCLAWPLFCRWDSRRPAGRQDGSSAPDSTAPCRATKMSEIPATFLQDFGLLGGIMALLVHDGLIHPYFIMTLHGILWHLLLIFIGLFCFCSGSSDRSLRGFLRTLPLYLTCCLIALAMNAIAGPASDMDMFYLSPWHPSVQPVVHDISLTIGIFPGMIVYIAVTILGALGIHLGFQRLSRLSWFSAPGSSR